MSPLPDREIDHLAGTLPYWRSRALTAEAELADRRERDDHARRLIGEVVVLIADHDCAKALNRVLALLTPDQAGEQR